MNATTFRKLCLGSAAALILAGCASDPPKESGYLSNYSMLHKEDAPGGGSRLVYENPAFTPTTYDAVWLEKVEFYPAPEPTDKVSMQTLNEIGAYADSSLRQKIGQRMRLADGPGPGVAHVRIAITAVGAQTEALKAYQYIPIGLAITGAVALVEGGRPEAASVSIESKVTDSRTQQLLFASVRSGDGTRIKSVDQGAKAVQPNDLKPLIDKWTEGAANQLSKYIRPK
ncbi:DUF3313 domain-containing protein [Schauerella aestuarii]|uniref:DUF3313 domain-containing protein n=1 Tax=Schauerella aestuarii TaxID=2511204 RepID=UPI00136BBD45|nr:DUF3313 domain-containing protein [Achromobacter aestuarii]MYZ43309.1 DUF3313 domain-containing protein [Achromobacter aestuarii]